MVSLRPSQAAAALGVSTRTFWRLASEDPTFPKVTKLSPRVTVVNQDDLRDYLERKAVPASTVQPAYTERVAAPQDGKASKP